MYGIAGSGQPVVFLHGWALGSRAYKRALKRLVNLGARVYAPALPGFGGTAELDEEHRSFAGYARFIASFLDEVGVGEPVILVGHSFGGAVAIQFASDSAERVKALVLIDAIGGPAWLTPGGFARSLGDRSVLGWGLRFPVDLWAVARLPAMLRAMLEDLVPNLIGNPRALWRAGAMVRSMDLSAELAEVKRRGLPVVAVWGEGDRVIPKASFDALCDAIGVEGRVVPGSHGWLIADPDAFGTMMTNVVSAAAGAATEDSSP